MFKVNKQKSNRFGERFEFKFSCLQAFQVPRGWDKLCLSIVSVESGKATTKSNKTSVRSGTCQWTETLSESILIPQNDISKELEECLFKIVLSMGSHRSGALGEVTVNLTDYSTSSDFGILALPLQKCSFGTILQVRIQCLNPKTRFSDEKGSKKAASQLESSHTNSDDMDNKLDASDNVFNQSMKSSSTNHLATNYQDESVNRVRIQCLNPKTRSSDEKGSKKVTSQLESLHTNSDYMDNKLDASDNVFNQTMESSSSKHLATNYQDESVNRDASFSASGSHRSSDSGDGSVGRSNFSPSGIQNGGSYVERLDSPGVNYNVGPGDDLSRSNPSSFNSGAAGSPTPNRWQESTTQTSTNGLAPLSLRPSGFSKDLLSSPEETIEELQDEAKMWERHAQMLKIDLAKLKKESLDKSKHQAELDVKFSAACSERDSLKQEVEQLKSSLEEKMARQNANGTSKMEAMLQVQKELEDELRFQKESNTNLSIQFKKTKEANTEFLAIIEELEETIEKQRLEMTNVVQVSPVSEAETDKSPMLSSMEAGRACTLSAKEEEITSLEKKVACMLGTQQPNKMVSDQGHHDLIEEIGFLRAKVEDLERDCAELTKENLELLYKMKVSEKETTEGRNFWDSDSEICLLRSQICHLEEELRVKEMLKEGLKETSNVQMKNLEKKCTNLELELLYFKDQAGDLNIKLSECQTKLEERTFKLGELQEKLEGFKITDLKSSNAICVRGDASDQDQENTSILKVGNTSDFEELNAAFLLQGKEVDVLHLTTEELEDVVADIRREKDQLEGRLATVLRESSTTSKCLEEVQHELMLITSSVDSHASSNKILERKSLELEISKNELEIEISELEKENIQLSERISGLETQLRYLTNEKESNRLQLDDSRSLVTILKNEVEKQQAVMELQREELKQKLQEVQVRLSETQEEIEYLKRSHSKLQSTAENLIEENSSLQKSNGDLRRLKLDLHDHIAHLEAELSESHKLSSEFIMEVECLELKISSLQKDIAAKERSLISQLESMFQEHKEQEEKISQVHLLLNQIAIQKTVEAESLKREMETISLQVNATHEERERMASDALWEVSHLRSDKVKLEASLHDANSKVDLYETELQTLKQEVGKKVQGLVDLLSVSKQSEEMLMADIERLQRQTEAAKYGEEKYKRTVSEVELKLKAADYEKRQILEETSSLKVKIQKMVHLQGEVIALKSSLEETKFEKGKIEKLLQLVSGECEGLKTERFLLTEKILNMQKGLHDSEDDRRSRIALEEKLLRLEGDLTAKEASYAREAELKNEVNRLKRSNSEYQRKIQCLEKEKEELMREFQALQNKLVLAKEENQNKKVSNKGDSTPNALESKIQELQEKICVLETDLAEARETINIYKSQLERLHLEKLSSYSEDPKSVNENYMAFPQGSKMASLEAELKEMQERYLHMSLQYAEVEAERGELVMKLKSMSKRRWFS